MYPQDDGRETHRFFDPALLHVFILLWNTVCTVLGGDIDHSELVFLNSRLVCLFRLRPLFVSYAQLRT